MTRRRPPGARPRTASLLLGLAVSLAVTVSACTNSTSPVAVDSEPITDDGSSDDPGGGSTPGDSNGTHSTDGNATGDGSTGDGSAEDGPAGDDGVDVGALPWTSCDDLDGFGDVTDQSFDCAVLAVPLDHDDPGGESIDLALVRLPAAGPRLGAVLLNPGGPGGSGVDFTVAIAAYASAEIGLDQFDIIGFDPRGVDRSNGLRCLDDDELDELLFPQESDTADEAANDTADENNGDAGGGDGLDGTLDDDRFIEACLERYGDTLRHFSTLATARDMDLIREALGDEQLSYIGISYGTYLGAAYATLFPDRVRALVLDSGFEPTGDTLEQRYLTQLVGFEDAFDAWAADCDSDEACAFLARPAAEGWDELRDRLDDDPLPLGDGRAADGSVLETATIAALYDPIAWSRLSAALADAESGDPSGLFDLADLYVGRNSDGSYDTIQQSNRIISCASGFGAAVPDDPEALAELIRTSAPRWGRDADADSFSDSCAPLMDPVELPALGFDGEAPVLVVGGVNDPATPFRWSEELAETMGPSASLVTWNGEGHGMLLASTCLMGHAYDVLVRLTAPESGSTCDPDPDVPRPGFWDDLPVPEGVSEQPLGPDAMTLLGLPPRLVYGEARTATLSPDELLAAYADELAGLRFESVGREEPIPGLIVETFLDVRLQILSIVVLADEVYDDPELAPARRLVEEGETLFALISFG